MSLLELGFDNREERAFFKPRFRAIEQHYKEFIKQ